MGYFYRQRTGKPKLTTAIAECGVRKALRPFLRCRAKRFVVVLVVSDADRLRHYLEATVRVLQDFESQGDREHDYLAETFNNANGSLSVIRALGLLEFLSRNVVILTSWDDSVPDSLRLAVDLVCEVAPPTAAHHRAAVRRLGLGSMSDKAVEFLSKESFDRVAAAAVPGRSLSVVMERLRTTLAPKPEEKGTDAVESPNSETAPPHLDDLHGYGRARDWGVELAQDIGLWRAGQLDWQDVDSGALLSGPPGCGKTSFSVSLAHSCGMRLVATSAAQWQSMGHLGDMLKAMRASFKEAKDHAPSLLFIDELDSVGTRDTSDHNSDYKRQVVNGLLECLDGVGSREGVVVLGATNFPDLVDPAVRRSGRLGSHFVVPLPDDEARLAILRQHLGDDGGNLDFGPVVRMTDGFSGADLQQIAKRARKSARRAGRPVIHVDVMASMPERRLLSGGERWRLAVHEAGHAVVGVLVGKTVSFVEAQDFEYVGKDAQALGKTVFGGKPTIARTAHHLRTEIAVCLAGLVSEDYLLGDFSSGSGGSETSDLTKATALATMIEGVMGMGGSLISEPAVTTQRLSAMRAENRALRRRVEETLSRQRVRVLTLVAEHSAAIEAVAKLLIDRTRVDGDVVVRLVDDPAFDPDVPFE